MVVTFAVHFQLQPIFVLLFIYIISFNAQNNPVREGIVNFFFFCLPLSGFSTFLLTPHFRRASHLHCL